MAQLEGDPMRISACLGVVLMLVVGGCAHKAAPATGEATAAAASKAEPIKIQSEEVTYTSGATPLKGFLAYPTNVSGKRPGVLVVHEWWGLNDYVRSRARQLAQLGYVALAVDMFGDGKTAAHPEDAEKFMMELVNNKEEGQKRFDAGMALLKANPRTDPEKVAVIGYCMGGAVALHMVRMGESLPLVATFHGNLATQNPLPPGSSKGKILVFTGGSDPFVPADQVAAFRKEMDAAGANYEIIEYPVAKHGFTNPGATELGTKFNIPLAYDEAADKESWAKFLDALAAL
jgi:dienelactone hydrolase